MLCFDVKLSQEELRAVIMEHDAAACKLFKQADELTRRARELEKIAFPATVGIDGKGCR